MGEDELKGPEKEVSNFTHSASVFQEVSLLELWGGREEKRVWGLCFQAARGLWELLAAGLSAMETLSLKGEEKGSWARGRLWGFSSAGSWPDEAWFVSV